MDASSSFTPALIPVSPLSVIVPLPSRTSGFPRSIKSCAEIPSTIWRARSAVLLLLPPMSTVPLFPGLPVPCGYKFTSLTPSPPDVTVESSSRKPTAPQCGREASQSRWLSPQFARIYLTYFINYQRIPIFTSMCCPASVSSLSDSSRFLSRISECQELNCDGSVRHGEVWFSSQVSLQEKSPEPDDDGMQ